MTLTEEIGRSKYVSLKTFRRNGDAVDTPVWHVTDGHDLIVISELDAGKVKRIRKNGRVVVTVCDLRGRVQPGAPSAPGQARLLNEADTQAGRALLARKYLSSRVGNWLARALHIRRPAVIGIAITLES